MRVFLLGKMSFNKPEFKRFREYRTKQSVNGTNNQFFRLDDLPPADECNEVFLNWFIVPLSSTENMIDVDVYMQIPIDEIQRGLQVVQGVYDAGAKEEDVSLTQQQLKIMK